MRNKIGSWEQLIKEIKLHLNDFYKPPIFFYWTTFVVIIGGVGVWLSIGKQLLTGGEFAWIIVFQNAATYAIAVLATSHAEINLEKKFSSSLKIFSYFLMTLGLAFAIIVIVTENVKWSVSLGIFCLLFSFILWFMANTKSEKFQEDLVDPIAAKGGDTDKDLTGNMEGIKY